MSEEENPAYKDFALYESKETILIKNKIVENLMAFKYSKTKLLRIYRAVRKSWQNKNPLKP